MPGTHQSPITYRTFIERSAGVGAFGLGCDHLSGMVDKQNLGLIYGDYLLSPSLSFPAAGTRISAIVCYSLSVVVSSEAHPLLSHEACDLKI